MANFWPGKDYLVGTNPDPPLIFDPTTTTSHGIEEPFICPKISKVWSINNPTEQLTPEPVVEGEMEIGDEGQDEPLPLRLKVQLPSRASFLANGVHQLELVLLYGHLEEHALLIDIHGPMMELPIQSQEESEISISANSFPSSPPRPPPISNQGDEGVVEELMDDPSPPLRKKIVPRRRRKIKQSTTCQICHKKFRDKYAATNHSFIHLSQEQKEAVREGWKNKCSFCSKRFQSPSDLDRHLLVHTREKPHPCDQCEKQFNHKISLARHQRLHDPDPDPATPRRPFNCEECDASFTTERNLTIHVNTVHLRLKEFQCPECGQKFGQKSNMTTHLNNIHLGTRYPCRKPHCGKSFTEKGHLRRHEKRAH